MLNRTNTSRESLQLFGGGNAVGMLIRHSFPLYGDETNQWANRGLLGATSWTHDSTPRFEKARSWSRALQISRVHHYVSEKNRENFLEELFNSMELRMLKRDSFLTR